MLTAVFPGIGPIPDGGGGLLVLLAKATVILAAARAITYAMRRDSAGARHLVWLVALGMLLLLPALTAWAPWQIAMLPRTSATTEGIPLQSTASAAPTEGPGVAVSTPIVEHATGAGAPAAAGAPDADASGLPVPASRHPLAWMARVPGVTLLVGIWAALALMIGASLAWSGLVVRRIVRRSRPLDRSDWVAPLLEVADRMGLAQPPRLLRSTDTKMPFACGVFTPTIVLPDECDDWSLDRRRAVLLHELAHVRRRDLLGHMLGRLVCAVYWFHPLAWMAAKRLRSESERACDDLAVVCGTRATDYAEHLLDIVTAVRHQSTPSVALAMARRKEFEGRMLAILDPELPHSSPSRRQSAALVVPLVLSAVFVAGAAPVSRSALSGHDSQGHVAPPVHAESIVPEEPQPSDRGRPMTRLQSVMPPRVSEHTTTIRQNPQPLGLPAGATTSQSQSGERDQVLDDRPTLLAKVLRTDSSASLRRIAAWGLEQYAESPAGAEALIGALKHDGDAGVREMAAWSLSSYDHVRGGESDEGDTAADTRAASGGHDVTGALGAALRGDADPEVRATAAWALGTIEPRGGTSALVAGLSDTSAAVRKRAAWALGSISPKQAPPALAGLLRDGDRNTRKLAAWALFQIQDPASLPALEAALRTEQDDDTRMAYVRAIAVMGDKSVDAIRGLLESSDARIKSMAVRALAGEDGVGPWPWPWPEPRPNP